MISENLLFILLLAAIAFVNVVLPWLRKQAEAARRGQPDPEREYADEDDDEAPIAPPPRPLQAPAALRVRHPEAPRRAGSPAPAMEHGMPAAQRRALLAPPTRLAEVRRGIVLRTILGPCRAQEPYDGSVS